MTYDEIQTLLDTATDYIASGKFAESEVEVNKVLVEIIPDVSNKKEDWLEDKILRARIDAHVSRNLGEIARMRGNYTEALEHYTSAQASSR